jgi:hypothetical protein
VPECPVFAHPVFSHPAWAPFKQEVLRHVAAQTDSLTQSAIVARADSAAISAIGACMTELCGQVGSLNTLVSGMKRDAADMKGELADTVRSIIGEALRNVAGAIDGGGTVQYLPSARPERALSPPRAPAPLALPAPPVFKLYVALGKVGSVQRVYNEWYNGDPQSGGTALKDMTVRCMRVVHADTQR